MDNVDNHPERKWFINVYVAVGHYYYYFCSGVKPAPTSVRIGKLLLHRILLTFTLGKLMQWRSGCWQVGSRQIVIQNVQRERQALFGGYFARRYQLLLSKSVFSLSELHELNMIYSTLQNHSHDYQELYSVRLCCFAHVVAGGPR